MTNHWVTSDNHFGHENIIRYCDRPFKHAYEMDEFMIQEWNKLIKPEDHVRHLGDVTIARGGKPEQDQFIRLIRRLNGHKRLILGNHDHFLPKVYIEAGFEKIQGTGQWSGDGIIYSHYPIHPDNFGRAQACVHGHIHQNDSPKPIMAGNYRGEMSRKVYLNVCVEKTEYRPVNLEEIRDRVKELVV